MEEIVVIHYENIRRPNWLLFQKAAKVRGINLITWEPHKIQIYCKDDKYYPLYDGQKINPGAILHRTVFRFWGIIFPALKYWISNGTLIINSPEHSFSSRDKLLTTLALCKANIPIVPSIGFIKPEYKAFSKLGDKKIIIKPAYGIRGRGIQLFPSVASAINTIDNKHYKDNLLPLEHYVAQPFINTKGRDIRAFVVDEKCIGIIERQAKPGEIRANIANGATAKPLPLSHPASKLAVAALRACKLDYGGVDMIEDKDGTIRVLEVDAWAGFSGLTKATGADVAAAILDMVLNRLERRSK